MYYRNVADLNRIILKRLNIIPRDFDLIVGTGGCRKVRLPGKGKGKSGGYRLITLLVVDGRVFLLMVYAKGRKVTLTHAEKTTLRRRVEGRT